MNELLNILREFTPGSAGVWTGVLMFAGWWLREWRETRKLSADDRLARREGYARQVEMLMGENRALHGDLATLRREYDHYRELCHRENDELRQMVNRLKGELEALKMRITPPNIKKVVGS